MFCFVQKDMFISYIVYSVHFSPWFEILCRAQLWRDQHQQYGCNWTERFCRYVSYLNSHRDAKPNISATQQWLVMIFNKRAKKFYHLSVACPYNYETIIVEPYNTRSHHTHETVTHSQRHTSSLKEGTSFIFLSKQALEIGKLCSNQTKHMILLL